MLAGPLNALPKHVASRTLKAPLDWQKSTLLEGDVPAAVAGLKREAGRDLLAIGSTELVHALMAYDLVDELRLMIDPVILGGGKRFFRDDGRSTSLRLVGSKVTSTGAILATYAREAR
jgi:dihydrofolate reductase